MIEGEVRSGKTATGKKGEDGEREVDRRSNRKREKERERTSGVTG